MKLYCKISDFFPVLLNLENLKVKKHSNDVHWKCVDKYIVIKYFLKKNFKYEILNDLYFCPNFVNFGPAFVSFSQCTFLNFLSSVSQGGRHFYSAPLA